MEYNVTLLLMIALISRVAGSMGGTSSDGLG